MAKRTTEQPYDPLDPSVAQSIFIGSRLSPEHSKLVDAPDGRGNEKQTRGEPAMAANRRMVAMPEPRGSSTSESRSTERRCREKRVMLSRGEERQIERLVDRLAEELKTSLKLSHLLRAAVSVLLHAEEELVRRVRECQSLHRPSNWDPVALAQFEHELARMVSQALRDSPPLRTIVPEVFRLP